jgi:hypothetical protein
MATAAVQVPSAAGGVGQFKETFQPQVSQEASAKPIPKHDVKTVLNYHKDNEDGSPPRPTYVGQPETYERPVSTHNVTIKDIRGEEDNYTLDGNGFQIHRHVSVEKDFVDDEQIKAQYYPETEQLLKDV